MFLCTNQIKFYSNPVVDDTIKQINAGESAILYFKPDVTQVVKYYGRACLQIHYVSAPTAGKLFGLNKPFYFVSFKDDIIILMAYIKQKLSILKDAGIKISRDERKTIKSLTTKTEVERYFWQLYDKYTAEY